MSALIAFGALCLFGGVWADFSWIMPCPAVEPVKDFNISRFSGRWYDNQRTAKRYYGITCYSSTVSRTEDHKTEMLTSFKEASGVKRQFLWSFRIPDASEPGKLKVGRARTPVALESDYFILGTDYDSYAVGYNCVMGSKGLPSAWILTRDVNPSSAVLDKAYAVAKKNHIPKSKFWKTEHTNCE